MATFFSEGDVNEDAFAIPGVTFINPERELMELSQKITTENSIARLKDFSNRVDKVGALLEDNNPATKIPLTIFKTIFFPIFSGAISEENNPKEFFKIYNAYLVHAGSPVNRVPVVDDNDNEKILFYIPALQNADVMAAKVSKLREANEPTFSKVQSTAEGSRMNGHDNAATELEEAHMEKLIPDNSDTIAAHLVYATHWNDICEFIGEPPIYEKIKNQMDMLKSDPNIGGNNVAPDVKKQVPPEQYNPDVDDYI